MAAGSNFRDEHVTEGLGSTCACLRRTRCKGLALRQIIAPALRARLRSTGRQCEGNGIWDPSTRYPPMASADGPLVVPGRSSSRSIRGRPSWVKTAEMFWCLNSMEPSLRPYVPPSYAPAMSLSCCRALRLLVPKHREVISNNQIKLIRRPIGARSRIASHALRLYQRRLTPYASKACSFETSVISSSIA